MSDDKPKLTKAQEVFIDEYLLCLNATEAYSRAYPKAKRTSAGANGHELLKNTEIKAEIDRRFAEKHMSADEALSLQADIARGDITQFFNQFGGLDFDKLRENGAGRLVKKLKQKTVTKIGKKADDEDTEVVETEIELYPADVAQERILKIHGKFKEQVDITSGGSPLPGVESDEERRKKMVERARAIAEEVNKHGS